MAGPLAFNDTHYNGGFPDLYLRTHPWTKVKASISFHLMNILTHIYNVSPSIWQTASIIFLDAPVTTGFSYSKGSEDLDLSDTSSARQTYKFIRKV